jgi:hypothetical protein
LSGRGAGRQSRGALPLRRYIHLLCEWILAMGSPRKPPEPKLFPNDFWDRPELSTQGDKDPMTIFAAVGVALSTWEGIEQSLATLCVVFSGLRDDVDKNGAYRRLFGAIDSGAARRKAIRKTAEVYSKLTPEEIEFPFHHFPWEYRYNSVNINVIIAKFGMLGQKILDFTSECINWKEKATLSSKPPAD